MYTVEAKKPHKCYHVVCLNCKKFQHVDHRCYIQPITVEEDIEDLEQDSEEDEENRSKKKRPPLKVIADFECYLDQENTHISPESYLLVNGRRR